MSAFTCSFTARNGHLAVLQWARRTGCPWDETTYSWVAKYGHLNVLKWARANGCPWDSYTFKYAEESGHSEVCSWSVQNGCPAERVSNATSGVLHFILAQSYFLPDATTGQELLLN